MAIELLDLGERRLKDVDRPERIAQVVYPGMPASFPPLKTVDAQPADTPFEGREDALAAEVAARFGWVRTRPRRGAGAWASPCCGGRGRRRRVARPAAATTSTAKLDG